MNGAVAGRGRSQSSSAAALTAVDPACRNDLDAGSPGPLVIDEYDTTIVVPPDMEAAVDEQSNLVGPEDSGVE